MTLKAFNGECSVVNLIDVSNSVSLNDVWLV